MILPIERLPSSFKKNLQQSRSMYNVTFSIVSKRNIQSKFLDLWGPLKALGKDCFGCYNFKEGHLMKSVLSSTNCYILF